jgi:hypothetical protein
LEAIQEEKTMIVRFVRLFFAASMLLVLPSQALPSLGWSPRVYSLKNVLGKTESKASSKAKTPKKIFGKTIQELVSGTVKSGPRVVHHMLYWLTSVDAIQSVFFNEYTSMLGQLCISTVAKPSMVPNIYSQLFYFAKLRPRLLYVIGALLRALQLCTPFRRVIDPTVGVGAGINLCSLLANSRWIKPLVLGWATTKWLWTWLGAHQVERAYVPITLSIHEWEKHKHPKPDKEKEPFD